MAKVIEILDGSMFTVGLGVGTGRANNLDDVTLVQYLLNLYFQHPQQARVRELGGAASKALAVDGLFGPKTRKSIELFQAAIITMDNARVAMDGRVDRLRDQSRMMTGARQDFYTIFELNSYACKLNFNHHDAIELRRRSDFPPRLTPAASRYLAGRR
ncbi:MAG: hypothetical protein DCF30_02430 [Hyphomicrobiales bacterium]|nr:MAG: hypothetical protein DCF30_02430 [Hyphomicrobiales bacterium]